MLVRVGDDDLIGIDHGEAAGLDVLLLGQCEQDVQELLIAVMVNKAVGDKGIGARYIQIPALGLAILKRNYFVIEERRIEQRTESRRRFNPTLQLA